MSGMDAICKNTKQLLRLGTAGRKRGPRRQDWRESCTAGENSILTRGGGRLGKPNLSKFSLSENKLHAVCKSPNLKQVTVAFIIHISAAERCPKRTGFPNQVQILEHIEILLKKGQKETGFRLRRS